MADRETVEPNPSAMTIPRDLEVPPSLRNWTTAATSARPRKPRNQDWSALRSRCLTATQAHLRLAVTPVEHPLDPLRQAPLFRALSLSQCGEIAGAARERIFSRNETIFVEGDALRFVYIVAAGRAKTIRHSAAGKLVILQLAGPGDVLDGLGASLGSTHSVTAQAMEHCQVLTWDLAVFESLTIRFPILQRNATQLLVRRLRMLEARFHELATERVPQRLARIFLRLIVQAGGSVGCSPASLSCEELAQMAGTTLFTVSRLLCNWAEQGIVQPERSAILFENLPGLIEVATRENGVST